MRGWTLAWLGAATLVVLLLAWPLQRGSQPEPGERFMPGLVDQLNDITALGIEPADGAPFRLERSAEGWRLPEQDGYRVDAALVRRLLLDLSEARIRETKTSRPELHDRLGVEASEGRPGSGVLVRIEGAPAASPVLLGQRETRGLRGTYVRLLDTPTAVLVDRDLQVDRTPLDWLDRAVLDIAPEEILALEIVRPDGDALRIDRDELGIFRISNLPEDRAPSGPTAAEALARVLSGLRLDDVRAAAGWDPGEEPVRAMFRLSDGLHVEALSWESMSARQGAAYWVSLAASADPDAPGAEARARALNAELSPWLYRFPAWKHEQLTRRLEDLLQPLDP
jgi:hypothetical protein